MLALETKQLVKKFGGVHAVDHVDISLNKGEITALIGPNGSGKSTCINLLTGMIPIDGGSVHIGEHTKLKKIKKELVSSYGITRTFQNVRVIEQISVLDNILVILTERNVWGSLFEKHSELHLEKAESILKKVGLWEKRHENGEKLSYGQRKLLEIARAVSMNSDIYFFDEPYAGLFTEMVKIVSKILEELKAEGKAVVLVEHNMDLIKELADRCYVLDSGKVIAEGTPDEVLNDPVVIDAYLGK